MKNIKIESIGKGITTSKGDLDMNIEYEIIENREISQDHRLAVSNFLKKQGKIQGNLMTKADRCKLICFAKHNNFYVGMRAIKPATKSVFKKDKANVPHLAKYFDWESGYSYVNKAYRRKGISSTIMKRLLVYFGKGNLMATTQVGNPVIKILINNGFEQIGESWVSDFSDDTLMLFVR